MWKRTKKLDKKYFNSVTDWTKYNYLKGWKVKKSNFNSKYVAEYINDVVIPKNDLSILGDVQPNPPMPYYIFIDMDIARKHFNEVIGTFKGGGAISNTYDVVITNETTMYFGATLYEIKHTDDYYYVFTTSDKLWVNYADSDTGFTDLGHQIITIPLGNEVTEFSYASMIVPNPDLQIGTYVYDDFTLQKVDKYVFKVTVGSTVYTNAYTKGDVNVNKSALNIPAVLNTREDNNLTVLSMYKLK